MNGAILLLCLVAYTYALGPPGPGGPCPNTPNSYNTTCGNKCQLSCDNIGEEVDNEWVANPKVGCEPGCSCAEGFIRNEDWDCVRQTRSTCDYDPCADRKHTLWWRCSRTPGPTCYRNSCKISKPKWRSRCVCKFGYGLNLDDECIKRTSDDCKALSKVQYCSELFN